MSVEIIGYGSKHSHEFKLTLTETSYDVPTNTSVLAYTFTLYKSSYSWSGASNITFTCSINGTDYTGSIPNYTAGSTLTLLSGSITVNHNADGTKTVGSYFNVYDGSGRSYACGNASGSGNIVLTNIQQGTTVTSSIRSTDWDRVAINWTAGSPSAYVQYSLNGASWEWANKYYAVENPDHYGGYFEIRELSPSTTYTVKVRCARLDTQVYSESGTLSVTTQAGNISITSSNINYGENLTVTLTNPSSLATTLVGTINSTTIISQSIVAGSNTITFTDEQLTAIYKEYSNISQPVTMTLTATASNQSTSTVSVTITFTGDRATVWIKDNGTWKKGIVWVKNNNTWKKGIAWKGVNGTWKKAL